MSEIDVALIQFDTVPEDVGKNLRNMEKLIERAVSRGSRWIMFHESTTCDYTPNLEEFAEEVPGGNSTSRMMDIARRHECYISFGLSERSNRRFYISQVFVGPAGFIYCYRKTWLWRDDRGDRGYRNEWARYDPGTGPEIFLMDNIKATCFICADGEAPRCVARARALKPQVVFYPNNRGYLGELHIFAERAKEINAPMLVTNRVGRSWYSYCDGGCVIYSANGKVLAKANRNGKEEVLSYHLEVA